MSSHVNVLVTVVSAGTDPWVEIENEFQIPFLSGLQSNAVSFIWFRQQRLASGAERFFGAIQKAYRSAISGRNLVSKTLRVIDWESGPILPWGSHHARELMTAELQSPTMEPLGDQGIVYSDFPNLAWLVPARIAPQLNYCLRNFEFTHILRTTSTSLIHVGNLIKWASECGDMGVYSGRSIRYLGGLDFVGGSGVLLSRDVVERIVQSAERLRLDLYDDVALGRLLRDLGVFPQNRQSQAFSAGSRGAMLGALRQELDQGAAVVRCKPKDWGHASSDVIQIMERAAQELTGV